MVLCRKCAHTTRLAMLSCPRCGFAFPYWRSRRWQMRVDTMGITSGKDCPRCGHHTTRCRSPGWVKPIRALSLHHCSYRTCGCGWHGLAFHARGPQQRRSRRLAADSGEP